MGYTRAEVVRRREGGWRFIMAFWMVVDLACRYWSLGVRTVDSASVGLLTVVVMDDIDVIVIVMLCIIGD